VHSDFPNALYKEGQYVEEQSSFSVVSFLPFKSFFSETPRLPLGPQDYKVCKFCRFGSRMNGISLEEQSTLSAISPLHKNDFPATQRSTTGYHLLQHIAPPAEHCHNLKNTTFQERGKTTGRGDAIASKERHFSPLAAI
jgi:hypothetical protein